MTVAALLPRSGRTVLGSINGLLASLLDAGVVDSLLVPVEMEGGRNVVQALVRDASRVGSAVPISPVMPVNSATLVSNLTVDQAGIGESSTVPGAPQTQPEGASPAPGSARANPRNTRGFGRLGVVLRSCEIRALVELVKLNQASIENVVVIGVDCPGSFTVPDYASIAASVDGEGKAAQVVERGLKEGGLTWPGFEPRPACRICEKPAPELGDVLVGFFGADADSLSVSLSDRVAGVGLEKLGLRAGSAEGRARAVDDLVARRVAARDAAFAEVRRATGSPSGLLAYFSACLTCHNCSVTCPICYCKQCVFTTSAFEHTGSQYARRAARKGALRMPADTVLYQVTRMNHMATSCVGCGQCESGCPSRIPLTVLFRSIGQKVQALYDYVPGRSLTEEPPVTTFREKELGEVAR